MSYHNTPDFEDYVTSPEWDDDYFHANIYCVTCGRHYGSHYGDDDEPALCDGYKKGTNRFIPDLPLKKPKVYLPDDLFTI